MNKDLKTATFYLLLAIGVLLWIRPWQSKETTVGELPAVTTNSVSAKAITNDRPTEAVVSNLIAVTTVTNTNTSDRISLGGKVQSEWR